MKEPRHRCDKCCKWQIQGELRHPSGFDYLGLSLCQTCVKKPPTQGWEAWQESRAGYVHPEYRTK